MAGFELSTFKEVLLLNKIFLGCAVLWGFIVGYLSVSEESGRSLYHFTAFGITLGFIASFLDCVSEVAQDFKYADSQHFEGITWIYLPKSHLYWEIIQIEHSSS